MVPPFGQIFEGAVPWIFVSLQEVQYQTPCLLLLLLYIFKYEFSLLSITSTTYCCYYCYYYYHHHHFTSTTATATTAPFYVMLSHVVVYCEQKINFLSTPFAPTPDFVLSLVLLISPERTSENSTQKKVVHIISYTLSTNTVDGLSKRAAMLPPPPYNRTPGQLLLPLPPIFHNPEVPSL